MSFGGPLTPDQLKFEEEFTKWEDGFRNWREQNASQSHLASYKNYMDKFLDIRDKLLEKRAQVYAKRAVMNNNDIRSTFQFQLQKAEKSAEDILMRYPAFDNNLIPSAPMMNYPPMRPLFNRRVPQQRMNPMIRKTVKPAVKKQPQPPPRQFPSNIAKYQTLLREAIESGQPKKCSGHMQILHKRLKDLKPDQSTWTEEEKALNEFCEYIYMRKKEIREAKEKAEQLAAALLAENGGMATQENSTEIITNVNEDVTMQPAE